MRVVLYQQDHASMNGLRDLLVSRGFEVRTAGMFNDLAGWLMLYGESTVLILELPAIDTFRRAVLKEVRRLAPGIGVVALAKAVTPEVQRDAEAAYVARVSSRYSRRRFRSTCASCRGSRTRSMTTSCASCWPSDPRATPSWPGSESWRSA